MTKLDFIESNTHLFTLRQDPRYSIQIVPRLEKEGGDYCIVKWLGIVKTWPEAEALIVEALNIN